MKNPKPPLTKKQEDRLYLWIIIGFLIIVGSLVIYLIYGVSALILAVPILVLGALLLTLPFLLLGGLEWLVKKLREREENKWK
ncbi:MAG: hypothetical protein BGO78_03670 [Chloroflexi bacterium 44-23]|nr:MAG: hypothetical protein BGO78_03670 [Chloroflexi bacterium 44-23]